MSMAPRYRALAGFVLVSAVLVAIFVALTLSAFHKPTPHDLPVGIVGSGAAQVEHALGRAAPGAFRFRSYPDQASATTGICNSRARNLSRREIFATCSCRGSRRLSGSMSWR